MCRSTDFPHFRPSPAGDRLDLKAFYVRFSCPRPTSDPDPNPFPDSLTLLYLPSIAGHALEIDGSRVRPDHPAFLTLHRIVTPDVCHGDVVYGSRDRVRAWPGLRFEVYLGEEKALRGSFRRDEGQEWRLECACVLEREIFPAGANSEAKWVSEVYVAAEGRVAMTERVEMVARKRSRKSSRGCCRLEEIPEEGESDSEFDSSCCCCGCNGEEDCGSDRHDDDDDDEEEVAAADGEDWEVNTEGVRWAVDVGIWVACLGVGYLVSKASAKSLRRRRLLL